jgi:hypothetical protein
MHLKISIIVLLSLFVSSLMAEVLTIPEDKTVIQFPAKLGNVTFAHKKHADLSITQCTTCHHQYQPTDTVIQPCHECHRHKVDKSDKTAPPKTKTVFHTRCIGCHEYTVASGEQAGPVKKKCKLCHVK